VTPTRQISLATTTSLKGSSCTYTQYLATRESPWNAPGKLQTRHSLLHPRSEVGSSASAGRWCRLQHLKKQHQLDARQDQTREWKSSTAISQHTTDEWTWDSYLLAHGGDEVTVQTTHRCDRAFAIIPGTQFEFVPPLCSILCIWDNFHKLKYIGLQTLSMQVWSLSIILLTAPLTAKSSPRSMVVPTAMNSLLPVSVLSVSRVTHSKDVTNSFGANS